MVRFAPTPGTHRHRVHLALSGTTSEESVAGRFLAGYACFSDRDGARVLRMLSDDSRRVRGIAMVVAPLACDDEQACEALHVAWSLRGERALLRRMRRRGRSAPIDRFLERLAAEGHLVDLVDHLPFGTEPVVRRWLHHGLERPSARFWEGLAIAHPAILCEILVARWRAGSGEGDSVTRLLTARHHPKLAERAPDSAVSLATLLLERGIEPDARVWTELLRRRATETVELAIRFSARVPDGAFHERVRELDPALLARVVSNAPHLLGAFGPKVRSMTPERQRALAEAWRDASERFPVHGAYLLRHLAEGPEREERRVAFERFSVAARDRDGVIAKELIAALPLDLAAIEARRHVREVTALTIDPVRRLSGVARYLPWAELSEALADHLGHPDGAMRAVALTEVLANPGVHPDDETLPARALELVLARKFEQDPVRLAMFDTLARWPRRVFRAEHLPAIARAIRDGLDASDLSVATAAAMQRLIVRLFGVDGAWAAQWLGTTIAERGALYDPNLGAKLSDADVKLAAPQLVEIAKTWTTQERVYWLVGFASGLGPRLRLVPGLAGVLASARDQTRHEWIAIQLTETLARWDAEGHAASLGAVLERYRENHWRDAILALARIHGLSGRASPRRRHRRLPTLPPALSRSLMEIAESLELRHTAPALSLLRTRAPEAFDAVLPTLVAKDETIAIVDDVHRWMHRHRQDQLDRYLADRPIRGRFATGKTRWLLPHVDGFFRWTPEQAERFANALASIVADAERDTPTVLSALIRQPRLEWASMDRLCALARDERPVVREKAIRVLAPCDAGQGVPTLLACLADERARFAVYGLRRALLSMPPTRALELLADVPMHKVTVAKEVVRLIGELRAPAAFARLEALAATKLHRDVRVALLRALWDHLDREPTWPIFERAVSDPDWVVASRLADIPANRLTRALDARLSSLLARLVRRPEPEARIALLRRGTSLMLVDPERALLDACRSRLSSRFDDEVRAATQAVLARSTEEDMPALEAAFDALREDPRALHVAASTLCAHDIRARRSHRLAATALESVALRDARWSAIAIRAAGRRANASELVETLARVAGSNAFDVDAAMAAREAVNELREEDLEATVDALASSPHAELRRVAVWALERDAAPARGWTDRRLALLARLRRDRSAAVAGAAARLWPPREDDPGFSRG
ncbi:MAG: hypothetical protein HYV09_20660 [Deltaproteobacteria bacterium]|nr:hypothetical protein [Deltaproteobacteria bacterium]